MWNARGGTNLYAPPVTRKRGGNFLLLDQERLADRVQLRWQLTDSGISGQLKIGNEVLDIHDIQSIYHRFVPPEDLTGTDSSSQVLQENPLYPTFSHGTFSNPTCSDCQPSASYDVE
jgi:hypothetical protein